MQSLIIPFADINAVQDIINLLRRHKQAFEIKDIEPSLLDDPNIVWEFPEPDTQWEKLGVTTLTADWDSPEDDHWNDFYHETKPVAL